MTIYIRTLTACKLFARRLSLRWLRKLVDLTDDRLHAAEVRLRDDLAAGAVPVKQSVAVKNELTRSSLSKMREGEAVSDGAPFGHAGSPGRRRVSFQEWEARRSGVAVISKKSRQAAQRNERRRRGLTAAQFDRRFLPCV